MGFNPRALGVEFAGIYKDGDSFYVRPTVAGKRTWHKLSATKLSFAIKEADQKKRDHAQFEAGERTSSPFCEGLNSFSRVSAAYLKAGCPHTRKRVARNEEFCNGERQRIEWLNKFFGEMDLNEIRLPILEKHAEWRMKQVTRSYRGNERPGERVVELEWVTLSNVISFGVYHSMCDFNHIRQQRPQLRADNPENTTAAAIRHSREVAPPSGDVVHQIAAEMFKDERSQPVGWLWLFACLSGLRRGELLALRMDAKPPMHPDGIGEPGWVDDKRLHVHRQKRSRIHWVLLHPALSELLSAHFRWHRAYAPDSPWYFPSCRDHKEHVDKDTAGNRLQAVCKRLELPQVTMHGGRSYFTTVLRSQGMGDAEIAARVGDSTVELIQDTYGNLPGNWSGGTKLSFLPSNGNPPAWAPWNAIQAPSAPSPSPAPVPAKA